MQVRAALAIAALEVRRRVRDRSLLIQGVVGPIVLAAIIGLAFGGGDGDDIEIRMGLSDEDGSTLSTGLVDGLREVVAGDDGPPVTIVDLDGDPATAVDDDTVDAALVVPAGFGDAVTSGGDATLDVYATGTRRVSADITVAVAEQLAASLDTTRLAIAVAESSGAPPPSGVVEPDLDVVEEPVGGDFDAVSFFAPSMAILFLFFTVGAGARSMLRERADGTLARVRAAPLTTNALLAGKAAAVLVTGVVSLLVVWGVTELVFGADWGDPAGVALVLFGSVLAISGIAALLTGLARTEEQAQSATSAVAFILAIVGGNFIAPGSLPPLFERLSLLTPNGWALGALVELSAGEASVADVLPAFGVLVLMGAVTAVIGTVTIRRSL